MDVAKRDSFVTAAIINAFDNIFKASFFDASTFRKLIQPLKLDPGMDLAICALHCIDYTKMDPGLRTMIDELASECRARLIQIACGRPA